MELSVIAIRERLEACFAPEQASLLEDVFDELYGDLVRVGDFRELKGIVGRLAQAQERTEQRLEQLTERIDRLAQAQERTEQRLEQLAHAQERTEQRLQRLSEDVQALVGWQRGEAGLRNGERYERQLVRKAWRVFGGGQGGSPEQPFIQEKLAAALRALPADPIAGDEDDPFLADLIWWKGDRCVVVEASLVANGQDFTRAEKRADTLRRAGVQATGMVIAEEWVGGVSRSGKEGIPVEWMVGKDASEGFIAFRRLE